MHTNTHWSGTTTDRTNEAVMTEQFANREARALTEYMSIHSAAEVGHETPGEYTVVSKSGRSYRVDLEIGTCDCNDAFYHQPSGGCRHLRRVQFATGRRPIPKWIDESELDDQLKLDIESE